MMKRYFNDIIEIENYLITKNEKRLERYANKLWEVINYFNRMSYNYGLTSNGVILVNVDNLMLEPDDKKSRFVKVNGSSSFFMNNFFLTIGLARHNTRLLILVYSKPYGSMAYSTTCWESGYILDIINKDLYRDKSKFKSSIKEFITEVREASKDKFDYMVKNVDSKLLMNPSDARKVIYESSNFDLD